MKEILDVIHKTIYQFFDVCSDDEEVPMSDKDKLLLEVNKAICNNLKGIEKTQKEINAVFEKIRDEIEHEADYQDAYINADIAKGMYLALEIFDKYKKGDNK